MASGRIEYRACAGVCQAPFAGHKAVKKPEAVENALNRLSPKRKVRKTFAHLMRTFEFGNPAGVADDIRGNLGYDGDLLRIFAENSGQVVHKWHHYIPLYDRYFAPFRGQPVRFLEIGVSKGGSLQMWRKYLGDDAILFGIDIDVRCAEFDGQAGQVRIGSQADPDFLTAVVDEMGGIDVVLDDGSHEMAHLRASLATLYPRLSDGGVYFVEDLLTSYWSNYGGGIDEDANFFNLVRELIDDMHAWYHDEGVGRPGIGDAMSGIHIHGSVAVFEKGPVPRPVHSMVG